MTTNLQTINKIIAEFEKRFTPPKPINAITLNGEQLLWGKVEDAKAFLSEALLQVRREVVEEVKIAFQKTIGKRITVGHNLGEIEVHDPLLAKKLEDDIWDNVIEELEKSSLSLIQ